jgi:hypothetical protein
VQFKSSNIEAFDFSNIFSFYLTLTVFIRKVLLCLFPTMGELCSADTISGWTQLSPTTFERPIDNLEGFLQFVGGAGQTSSDKQHWHTTTSVKVKTNRENFGKQCGITTHAIQQSLLIIAGSTMLRSRKSWILGLRRRSMSITRISRQGSCSQ